MRGIRRLMVWCVPWAPWRVRPDKLGVDIEFLSPDGFPSFQLPTYPGLRLAIPNRRGIAERIEAVKPDAIHLATEGPIGFAVRAYCRRQGRPFTTSYTTRFPEYISARVAHSGEPGLRVLRWFHSGATVTMVATPSLMSELGQRGFQHLGMWTRGVDVDLFRPDRAIDLGFRTPHFHDRRTRRGREEFGSVPVARASWHQGCRRLRPAKGKLKREFPDAKFLGPLENGTLRRASGRRRCFCFSESHRHVRHCSARGAGKRGTDCGVPGDRPERRGRRPADWGSSMKISAAPASRL